MMTTLKSDLKISNGDDEIAAMVPFHLTGQLDTVERKKVEQWLETAPNAQKVLDHAKQELDSTIVANEAISPPAGALAKLNAEIERSGVAPTPKWSISQVLDPIAGLFDFGDRRLAWASAMALLLITGLQTMRINEGPKTSDYELAAGKTAVSVYEPGIATVIFSTRASASDVSSHLQSYGAHITGGPRGQGIYQVQFKLQKDGTALTERMSGFAANKDIVLLFQKPRDVR